MKNEINDNHLNTGRVHEKSIEFLHQFSNIYAAPAYRKQIQKYLRSNEVMTIRSRTIY
jgi:hypothetical protein